MQIVWISDGVIYISYFFSPDFVWFTYFMSLWALFGFMSFLSFIWRSLPFV